MSQDPLEALERYYRAIEPKPARRSWLAASLIDLLVGSSIGLALAGLTVAFVMGSPSDPARAETAANNPAKTPARSR